MILFFLLNNAKSQRQVLTTLIFHRREHFVYDKTRLAMIRIEKSNVNEAAHAIKPYIEEYYRD